MKRFFFAAVFLASAAGVHAGEMKGMDMKGAESMASKSTATTSKSDAVHQAAGVVKKIDPTSGKVTVAHEPVKTLNWPSMNMVFHVKDKSLLSRLSEGRKVDFEFQQQGKEYVITAVR